MLDVWLDSLRTRRRDPVRVSAIPPYHPDYRDELAQHQEDDEVYSADGERFGEYGKGAGPPESNKVGLRAVLCKIYLESWTRGRALSRMCLGRRESLRAKKKKHLSRGTRATRNCEWRSGCQTRSQTDFIGAAFPGSGGPFCYGIHGPVCLNMARR